MPFGFWELRQEWHRFLRWLGRQLGFRLPRQWFGVTTEVIVAHGGAMLTQMYSIYDILREFMPGLDWEAVDGQRIRKREILAWADAYHAKHGKWPVRSSGPIPGITYTWQIIDASLRYGHRGLPPGSSLARFLTDAGASGLGLGRLLSEKQILAWADAHFEAHGKWPSVQIAKWLRPVVGRDVAGYRQCLASRLSRPARRVGPSKAAQETWAEKVAAGRSDGRRRVH